MEKPGSHIVIVPTAGMGHLIPLVEFAKKLLLHHNISTTFILANSGPLSTAQKSFLSNLPLAIDSIVLPPVSLDDLHPSVTVESRVSLTIARSLPSIRDAVKSVTVGGKKVSTLVADFFATDAVDVANEFNIPPYLFFASSAMSLSLFLYLHKLDKMVSCEYREVTEKFKIPGCVPLHGRDFFDPVQDRTDETYRWMLHHANKYRMAEGIILNSFKELEPGAIEALQQKEIGKPDVYPIGPLIKMGSKSGGVDDSSSSPCLKWLDEQPISSVLYVSFGSGGTLSLDQMIELALGLEMSEQRFLWVLRCPNDKMSNGTYFNAHNTDDPMAYLPEKFLDRTKDRGLVVPMWAPQVQILAHVSTCAFLTHCGWNSTLESVVNGTPMIAWPLYAEQKMNALLLNEDVKVALRPKISENGLVGRVEVCNVVKSFMEGEEGKGVQSRMRNLKDCASKVLGTNGSSTTTIAKLAEKWKEDKAEGEPVAVGTTYN